MRTPLLLALVLLATPAAAATCRIGPGRPFRPIPDVVSQRQPGDVG